MGAPLRVLAATDFYAPRRGGIERVVAETARALRAHGVTVEVLTRRLEAGAPAREVVDGVVVHRIGDGPQPLAVELPRLFRAGRAFARRALGDFDLVHAHLTLTALPLLAPAAARGLPLVATFYGPWDREYRAEMASPPRARASPGATPWVVPSRWPRPLRPLAIAATARLLRALQGRVLARARTVVVLSAHSAGELRTFGYTVRHPVERVPGGVDVDRFRPIPRSEARARLGLHLGDGPVLMTVRRLVPRMGLDALLEAVRPLAGATLLVAGTGPLAGALGEKADRMGIGSRVRLLGEVADADLPALYAAADVAVLPTRALEGFGLPVLEAWACGVPVVATPVGALAETVAALEPTLLAADASAPALAATLGAFLARPEAERRTLGERARELARSYRWEVAAERLAGVYRDAVAAGASSEARSCPEAEA